MDKALVDRLVRYYIYLIMAILTVGPVVCLYFIFLQPRFHAG